MRIPGGRRLPAALMRMFLRELEVDDEVALTAALLAQMAASHRPSSLLAHQFPRHDEIRRREVCRDADPARAGTSIADGVVTRNASASPDQETRGH